MSKFKVGNQFRKNPLANVSTRTNIEVHIEGKSTKVYDNIHYPSAFARKVFNENVDCTHVVVRTEDGEETINRPDNDRNKQ